MVVVTGKHIVAWCVHGLTASGAIVAALSLLAISLGDARAALLYLVVALVIDGADGPLARAINITETLPSFDGAMLDLVVDYLTYVFVPVVFAYSFDLLPQSGSMPILAFVLLSSLYLFCNRNMKSKDNYFVGFPAIWNIAVLYAFVFDVHPNISAAMAIVLSVLSFVPIKTVHPIRVQRYRKVTFIVSAVWLAVTIAILLALPNSNSVLNGLWVSLGLYYIVLSVWRTMRFQPDTNY